MLNHVYDNLLFSYVCWLLPLGFCFMLCSTAAIIIINSATAMTIRLTLTKVDKVLVCTLSTHHQGMQVATGHCHCHCQFVHATVFYSSGSHDRVQKGIHYNRSIASTVVEIRADNQEVDFYIQSCWRPIQPTFCSSNCMDYPK